MSSRIASRYIPLEHNPVIKNAQSAPVEQKVVEITAQLERSLKILDYWSRTEIQAHRSSHDRDSIYHGISGIAFAEYHLSQSGITIQISEATESLSRPTIAKVSIADADAKLAGILRNVTHIPSENHFHPSTLSFIETPIGLAILVLTRSVLLSSEGPASQPSEQLMLTIGDGNANPRSRDANTERIKNLRPSALAFVKATVRKTLEMDSKLYQPGHREDRDLEDGCEVLYGRAGLLYGLLYLRNTLKDINIAHDSDLRALISDDTLGLIVEGIITRGRIGAQTFEDENAAMKGRFSKVDAPRSPRLMWKWHGRRYLGAAHGVVGILQMLLSCPLAIIQRHLPEIIDTLHWLTECQDPEGNWPKEAPDVLDLYNQQRMKRACANELVHWCHGAPGALILLSTTLKLCKRGSQLTSGIPELEADGLVPRLEAALTRGGMLIYRRGLLRKGVGLCHGVAGSVYALLAVSDVLDSGSDVDLQSKSSWLQRALELAHIATSYDRLTEAGEMSVPDHPMSLYQGLAGMCCAWSEVLKAMKTQTRDESRRGMPGYSDILSSLSDG
ncbi:hypothetical protein BJ165DRAFT_1528916 [Panaeolus papilionaceus]|nr:hypothetical protein BJ165DRAFT_1528916 [Panaeolus papilionaceus]